MANLALSGAPLKGIFMRLQRRLALPIFCAWLSLTAAAQTAAKKTALQADLQTMTQMFEGEFDNHLQAWEEKEQKAELPHEHIHSIFARVKLPAFGENVFYVKQYMDGDPAKIYRTRLYSFAPNEKEGALELRIYTFPDEKAVNDAHLDQSKLAGLAPAKMGYYPGCEVYWKRNGEAFDGYMKKDACRVESKRSGRTLIISDDLKLTKDQIAWRFLAPAGITGLWQITKRGKENMSEDERIQLDMEYAIKNSFLYDIKILLGTLPALLQKQTA